MRPRHAPALTHRAVDKGPVEALPVAARRRRGGRAPGDRPAGVSVARNTGNHRGFAMPRRRTARQCAVCNVAERGRCRTKRARALPTAETHCDSRVFRAVDPPGMGDSDSSGNAGGSCSSFGPVAGERARVIGCDVVGIRKSPPLRARAWARVARPSGCTSAVRRSTQPLRARVGQVFVDFLDPRGRVGAHVIGCVSAEGQRWPAPRAHARCARHGVRHRGKRLQAGLYARARARTSWSASRRIGRSRPRPRARGRDRQCPSGA